MYAGVASAKRGVANESQRRSFHLQVNRLLHWPAMALHEDVAEDDRKRRTRQIIGRYLSGIGGAGGECGSKIFAGMRFKPNRTM